MQPSSSKRRPNFKALSALVGGSAIVAMGALAAVTADDGGGTIVSKPGTFTSPVTSSMTMGDTTKSSAGEMTVVPLVAKPPVTASP
jgi:hypothetical protein